MNTYISDQIEKSLLQYKKFEIQIYDAVLTHPHIELTQGKNGYFVSISGFPTLEKLVSIVDYFSKPNWQPFIVGVTSNTNSDVVAEQIVDFYKANARSIPFPKNSFSVWNQDDIYLKYMNDRLQYYTNETLLPIEATSSLPVKINDRFLLFERGMIFVLKEQKISKKLKIDTPISEDYDTYQYNTWVNICNGGEHNWHYSYSYTENRFYKRSSYKND
ncbi:MAG: hypothetical protein AB8B65_00210 [Kordia sp.]|uniref:hypothetical protein n=1 Tax=Kordia sp. TaxID=1965332 RepID=UPI0038583E93